MIQTEHGYSDREVTLQIQEPPYLQYFCGYVEYDDSKQPFDPPSMVYFPKRLTSEIMRKINEIILLENKEDSSDDNDKSDGGNSGTMIADATCAPSDIKYPQERVTSKVTNGSIVLFHNDADHTPEALPTILKCLKDEGYRFVFISDLIYKDNYKMDHAGKQVQCEPAESATSSVNSNP